MRRAITGIGAIVAIVLYAAYFASGANDGFGFVEWLRSLFTRASLVVDTISGSDDPMTEAVNKALAFIAAKEGFSSRAYADPPGQSQKFSIGYGHQIVPGDGLSTTSVITEEEGFSLLASDVAKSVDDVYSTITVDLTSTQAAALISFRYNVGGAAFRNSTLVKLLNSGDIEGAASQFLKWIYAGGKVSNALIARRNAEQALFLS